MANQPSYRGEKRPLWRCWCGETHHFPVDTPSAVLRAELTAHNDMSHPGPPFVPTAAQIAGHRANGGVWPIPTGGTR